MRRAPRDFPDGALVAVFAGATLASALLMFTAEPLLAKMLLPAVGGAPAVWSTSLVFFQAVLLAGYAFAHASSRLGPRAHALVHAGVVAGAACALPIALHVHVAEGAPPPVRVLALLGLAAGAPFFALASNGPAIARLFASVERPRPLDPYALYAASNLGSIVALVAYPLVVEPALPLSRQVRWFGVGYGVLVALTIAAAAVVLVSKTRGPAADAAAPAPPAHTTAREATRWAVLGAIPSAYLVAVSQHLSTNVAAAPLLWIGPLFLYLASFVLVFAARLRPPPAAMARALPLAAAVTAATLASEVNQPAAFVAGAHLLAFFLACMVAHGALADTRPPPARLTAFYLWMSTGGVVGGLAAALVAPAVLDRTAEYPLVVVLALAVRPAPTGAPALPPRLGEAAGRRALALDLAFAAAAGAVMLVCVRVVRARGPFDAIGSVILAAPLFLALGAVERPRRYALAVGAFLLASATHEPYGATVARERNFFGALRVARDPTGRFVQLVHGTTVHGRQALGTKGPAVSTSYYHRTGPAGDVLARHAERPPAPVAVVGLGVGSLGAYARAGEDWTFYEINPAVVRFAQDARHFTFLAELEARGARALHEVGDARLRLAAKPDRYGLVVVDAFSSDAIPVHLVTEEAVRIYVERLLPGGLLAWHVSNDYLELEPMLAALAARVGLVCVVREDLFVPPDLADEGKFESKWAVMARATDDLGERLGHAPWRPARVRDGVPAWTDDASSLLPLIARGR